MNHPGSIRVFIDSDVVISSLISTTGAAYALLHDTERVKPYVSNFSTAELEKVVGRLNLKIEDLHYLLSKRLGFVEINQPYQKVQQEFAEYVRDMDDAHIVAGAKEAKATFLVSYNIRHFEAERLKQDFLIILLTPGMFLQYLRCL